MPKEIKPLNFAQLLAEKTIRDQFEPSMQVEWQELNKLAEFCQREENNDIYKVYLKLQRLQINNQIVNIVVSSLPSETQRLVYYRYRYNKSYTWISMQLNVSERQLKRWMYDIIENVRELLNFNLSARDIFSPAKVRNIVHILDNRIKALMWRKIPVYEPYLAHLIEKRRIYQSFFFFMQEEEFWLQNPDSKEKRNYQYHRVIHMKFCYPHNNVAEISEHCSLSSSSISKYLNQYTNRTKSYIAN